MIGPACCAWFSAQVAGAASNPLLAQTGARTVFEWGRVGQRADWLWPCALWAGLLLWSWWWYRGERGELPRGIGSLLFCLRGAALLGLILVNLEPQWRTLRDLVSPSRVVLLVDTSLSMALADPTESSAAGPSRAAQAASALAHRDLVQRIRTRHELILARFDDELTRLATLPRRTASDAVQDEPISPDQWTTWLTPHGASTRLGPALQQVLTEELDAPLSGIVVLTDGGHNAGLGPLAAAEQAARQRVPIFPIGLGSAELGRNVRVSELVGPSRVTPGDRFTVTAFLHANGLAGREARLELSSRAAGTNSPGQVEGSQVVALPADGEALAVRFDLTPAEPGLRTVQLTVVPPNDDQRSDDNRQEIDVEVVSRPLQVLLLAGGPGRDFQFLRNLLARDETVEVDVCLQTAGAGASQEARRVLDQFPATRAELFAYDAILAFDPDWAQLSAESRADLAAWVSEQAGGLLVVAGPIYTGRWADQADLAVVARLYPVDVRQTVAQLPLEPTDTTERLPLRFSSEGDAATFLRLGETLADSQAAWSRFGGVYTCYPAAEVREGATVYVAAAAAAGDLPLVAGQFYGAGRVLYSGSAEWWRLRRLGDAPFEQFYTKLVRYLAQGRMLRGTSRGVLLVDRDRYWLGQTIAVRARLKDARLGPLVADAVELAVAAPDRSIDVLRLAPVGDGVGEFAGQFVARQEGTYRLELATGDAEAGPLTRRLTVDVPDLEREIPNRQDQLLGDVARASGGEYYVGFDAALGLSAQQALVDRLVDHTRTTTLSGTPVPLWDNVWVMLGLCGLLCTEWLLRRLWRLA